MNGLTDKVILVTGAGSGIGRAVSLRLAAEGAYVAALDLRLDAADEVANEIRNEGGRVLTTEADVTSHREVSSSVRDVKSQLGQLHGIVNSAGVALGEGGVVDCDEESWDKVMAVNLKSMFLTGKSGIPAITDSGGGAIVNIASVFGFVVNKDECAYAASKGAVINLTRQMALQHVNDNIRVNAICPADSDTPLIANLLDKSGGDVQTAKTELAEPIPMGRLADPFDIAAAVTYLLSADASFITGVSLPVDGGFLVQ